MTTRRRPQLFSRLRLTFERLPGETFPREELFYCDLDHGLCYELRRFHDYVALAGGGQALAARVLIGAEVVCGDLVIRRVASTERICR